MIKFVEKWFKSDDEKAIDEDGALNKWMDPKDGLPSTDREVTVLVLCSERDHAGNYTIQKRYKPARFNPAIGWQMEGSGSSVIFWRDEDDMVTQSVRKLIERA